MSGQDAARGFTLVEVLVSLLIMAILATMAWQGLDGIMRSRDVAQGGTERILRLQSVIAQWEADLNAAADTDALPQPLQFNGAALLFARRSEQGMQLVVWALRGQAWQRWVSPATLRTADLTEHWMRAQQLLGNEPNQLGALSGVLAWRLYCYRGNAWSNCQSTADVNGAAGTATTLPKAMRLELDFAEGSGWAGTLVRDVRLPPRATP